ncbi:hypothetical protein WJX73_000349 [Symbiochloris irregularis]|uniref:F-box domain-containing protein n=1 Tax=Symbiochloris irregularis TaxID=706552 RepID=A0AAW1NV85_9CHLO
MALLLPVEIVQSIFKQLDFTDKVICQLVCKQWTCLLRSPTDHVWDTVRVRTSDRLQHEPSAQTAQQSAQAYLPISSWLTARAAGVKAAQILHCCCCKSGSCPGHHKQVTACLACLMSVPVDVHLDFLCYSADHLFMEEEAGGSLACGEVAVLGTTNA